MGNSKSQPCRRSRPMYLLYLINRTWRGKVSRDDDKEDCDFTIDRQSEFSSRCSGCKSCGYQQDSLTYDSESEMAPNAEEELVAVKPWGPQPEKERLRPPTYNAEDYANALRRWGRRPVVTSQDSHGTLPSTTSSSSGYASGSGEMTLRQFTSVSELLNKLRADLRLAFPSFVQEFASAPADGITLLLETLRGVQLILSSPPSGQGGPRMGTRRAALDELGCVECLAACGERCADAPRLLSKAQPGLLALAVCLTSSLNRSRVLALQLLTKVCQAPGGHLAVSEAVSTLRLRYGEGGRFRFLAGALLAPRAAIALRVAGIAFLNAFLKSAPRPQARLYIQAEACEAGLEPRVLQAWLTEVDGRSEDALTDLLHKEVQKWSHNCVDVEELQKRLARAEETCAVLGNKVALLQGQLDNYRMEKINGYNSDERKSKPSMNKNSDDITVIHRGMSSNAEDEGISSSERSSSPSERGTATRPSESKIGSIDNDQETTIDDVIEELRIIVKDAEEEFEDSKAQTVRGRSENSKEKRDASSKISIGSVNRESAPVLIDKRSVAGRVPVENPVTYFGRNEEELSVDSAVTRKLSSGSSARIGKNSKDASVKIVIKSPEVEDAIVPAILYPQPPRRAPPCLSTIIATREGDFLEQQVVYNAQDDDDDDDDGAEEDTLDDGSDSLLSASRLKYNPKNESSDLPAVPSSLEARDFYVSNEINATDPRNPRPKATATTNSRGASEIATVKTETKTARSFDGLMNLKNLRENDSSNYPEVYKQFEPNGRSIDPATPSPRRSSKHQSEVEKRKSLRRSASQDLLGSSASSPRSSGSRIESRIRKFETLNAFENSSLRSFVRHDERAKPSNERKGLGASRLRMQRSESFHHVSHTQTGDSPLTRGGSDSGLLYVTDYDLEPFANRRHAGREAPTLPANLLTKSLDRIDEGFDSMIDGAILQGKRCQTVRSVKGKHGRSSKARGDEKSGSKSKYVLSKGDEKRSTADKKNPKNDERVGGKPLRSDELYDDGRNRRWNFRNEVDGFRRVNDFPTNRNTITDASRNGSPRESYRNDGTASRYSTNDSGVYLPSGRYDAFGLGKSRFNAGKYSGHPATSQDNNIGVRRNSTATLVAKRGKVTDILSGLY